MALLATAVLAGEPTRPALIPLPQKMEAKEGAFTLQPGTRNQLGVNYRKGTAGRIGE
jgi:hypothetical protein